MISAINYIAEYCSMSKVAIRIDDDVAFQPTQMIDKVISLLQNPAKSTYPPHDGYHKVTRSKLSSRLLNSNSSASDNAISNQTFMPRPALKLDEKYHGNSKLRLIQPNTVICSVLKNRIIHRDKGNIYNVGSSVLPGETHYPQFCAGFFIAFTSDLLPKFKALFSYEPPFWIDDSYLGVLQRIVKTTNVNIKDLLLFRPSKSLDIDFTEKLAVHLRKRNFYRYIGGSKLMAFSPQFES